jgi:hypothetical protein
MKLIATALMGWLLLATPGPAKPQESPTQAQGSSKALTARAVEPKPAFRQWNPQKSNATASLTPPAMHIDTVNLLLTKLF